tara:strand:+ start:561 stop:1235 length:675 start_codon:yes stop_codon:yes gene_type:complete
MFPFPFSFIATVADTPVEQIANTEAMSFNGIDQYIDSGVGLGNALGSSAADMTISMWVNITPGASNDGIFKIGALGSNVGKFAIRVVTNNDTRIQVYLGASSVYKQYDLLAAGNWNHIAIVKEGTTVSGYINGTLTTPAIDGGSIPSTLDFSNEPTFVGAYWDTGFLFNGKIDEVAVFNTHLSADKIQQIYDATALVGGVPQTANLFTGGLSSSLVYWNRMGDS